MKFPARKVKPCHVVLNDIKGLLDGDGFYTVPGRSRKALTCYRCFKKFYSAEALEVHKAEHEPESGEEDIYAISDSEIEIESESDEEEKETLIESPGKSTYKSPSQKKGDHSIEKKLEAESTDIAIEYIRRPPETPQPKQVQVVEPIMGKPRTNIANVPIPQQTEKPTLQTPDGKKVPVLCNIKIKCLSCDVLFTNSEFLMQHKSVDDEKPCCFTCKACSESYSQPADYLNHIMQHNTFSSSRYGYRGGAHRRKPEFRCTYCQKEFKHRFLLKQHEDTEHKKQTEATMPTLKPIEIQPKSVEIQPKPIETTLTPKKVFIPTKPNIEVGNPTKATPDTAKPKIWVIKEALIKSPEPPTQNEEKSVEAAPVGGVKRKLDEIEALRELIKPGKRGRPSKTSSSHVVPGQKTPASAENDVGEVSSLTCDECFDVFQTKAAFDEHMVFHGINKDEVLPTTSGNVEVIGDYPCNLCNMLFKSVAGLRRHQTCIHEKMTSFDCVKCSKIFLSRKCLNIHRSSCTGVLS